MLEPETVDNWFGWAIRLWEDYGWKLIIIPLVGGILWIMRSG